MPSDRIPRDNNRPTSQRRPSRRQPPAEGSSREHAQGFCEIKAECATCRFINGDYRESLQTKFSEQLGQFEQLGLFKKARVLPPVPSPLSHEYRAHAKLAVRPALPAKDDEPQRRFAIGLFKPGSHDIVDLGFCPLHRRTINFLLRDLQQELETSDLTPYDEPTRIGVLRYVAIRAAHLTSELMVTFVVTQDASAALRQLVSTLRQRGHNITSAHMNLNNSDGNAIFGEESRRLAGADRLRERVCELDFEIGPSSFFQVNPWIAEIIYRRIEQLSGQRVVNQVAWDLYSGIGAISMILSRSGYQVLGIEENPQAVRDAQLNATRNHMTTMPYHMVGRVEDVYSSIPNWAALPKVIVVNPSRRGLAEPVRRCLADIMNKSKDTQLIYMSCEGETLARDLADLQGQGCQLRQIEAFDMFPFTEKLEWLAVVTK